jgi:hypothetical protein
LVGECDGDGTLDTGDLPAIAAEIFDGDGTLAEDAPGSSFADDPIGCCPAGGGAIDAADLTMGLRY